MDVGQHFPSARRTWAKCYASKLALRLPCGPYVRRVPPPEPLQPRWQNASSAVPSVRRHASVCAAVQRVTAAGQQPTTEPSGSDAEARQGGAGPGPGSVLDTAGPGPGSVSHTAREKSGRSGRSGASRSNWGSGQGHRRGSTAGSPGQGQAPDTARNTAPSKERHDTRARSAPGLKGEAEREAKDWVHPLKHIARGRAHRVSSSSSNSSNSSVGGDGDASGNDRRGAPEHPAVLTSWIAKATKVYYLRSLMLRLSQHMDTGHLVSVAYRLARISSVATASRTPAPQATAATAAMSSSKSGSSAGASPPRALQLTEKQEAARELAQLARLVAPHLAAQPPQLTLDQAVTLLWSCAHVLSGARPPGKANNRAPGWTIADRSWYYLLPMLDGVLGMLCTLLQDPSSRMEDHRLCMALWAVAQLELATPGRWEGRAQDLDPGAARYLDLDLAPTGQQLLGLLSARVAYAAHQLSVRDTASCMWALAAAGQPDPTAFSALIVRAEEVMREAAPEEHRPATASSAAEQVQVGAGLEVEGAAAPAPVRGARQTYNVADVSNMLWALVTAHHHAPGLLNALEGAAATQLSRMEPRHMASITWSLAVARRSAPTLLPALYARAAGRLHAFSPSELAQMMWAAATQVEHAQQAARSTQGQHEDGDMFSDIPLPTLNTSWASSFAPADSRRGGPGPMAPVTGRDGAHAVSLEGTPGRASVVAPMSATRAHTQMLGALVPYVQPHVSYMRSDTLSLVAWAVGSARITDQRLFEAIQAAAARLAHSMNDVSLAILMWMAARVGEPAPRLLGPVCKVVMHDPTMLTRGPLCMVLWALATLQEGLPPSGADHPPAMVPAQRKLVVHLAMAVRLQMQGLGARELSNCAWALAELRYTDPDFWDALAAHLTTPLRTSSASGVTSAVDDDEEVEEEAGGAALSAAAVGPRQPVHRGPRQRGRQQRFVAAQPKPRWGADQAQAAASVLLRLDSMTPFELSKLVWGFAKAGHVDEDLFQEVSARLCAAVRAAPHPLSRAATQDGPGGRGALFPGTVARTMWAFTMQGRHDDPLLPLLVPHARAMVRVMEPRDTAAVLWALAASGGAGGGDGCEELAPACAAIVARSARSYRPTQLAQVVWALGALHATPGSGGMYGLLGAADPVADAASRALRTSFDSFSWEDVASVMWGLAVLGHHDPDLMQHVKRAAATRLLQGQFLKRRRRPTPGSEETEPSRAIDRSGATEQRVVGRAGHLVQLLHSLAMLGESDAALSAAAAPAITFGLDELDTEVLVEAVWAYACTLPPRLQCTPTFAQRPVQAARSAAPGKGSGEAAGAAAAVQACAQLLLDTGIMLGEVVKPSRAQDLSPRELRMLWQAHHRVGMWADAQPADTAGVPYKRPFAISRTLLNEALRVAMLTAPRGGARRPLAEVAAALGELGFSTLGRSGGGDPALSAAGPHWVGGEQGHDRVAVMVVSSEHVVRRASPPRLLAEHALCGEALRAAGWHVVHVWLPEWGAATTLAAKTKHLRAALTAAGLGVAAVGSVEEQQQQQQQQQQQSGNDSQGRIEQGSGRKGGAAAPAIRR